MKIKEVFLPIAVNVVLITCTVIVIPVHLLGRLLHLQNLADKIDEPFRRGIGWGLKKRLGASLDFLFPKDEE